MKKLFMMAALVMALIFAGCDQPTDGDTGKEDANKITFTIKNESSYDLSAVKWSNVSFASNNADLLKAASSTKDVAEDAAGYINFTRNDIGIELRTERTYSQSESLVTITNNTLVLEVGNESNRGTLSNISLLPRLAVERNSLQVAQNDVVNTGESTISIVKQIPFIIKNTGKGTLTFTGNAPVKSSDPAFTVVQPSGSEIAPNASLNFTLNFTPTEKKTYTTTVTITSNDKAGNFTFTVSGSGVAPKPIINIFYNNAEIPQDGTIDRGEVFLTQSKAAEITVRNSGAVVLTLDINAITITGTNAAAFSLATPPSQNISSGNESKFSIQCAPAKTGENSAIVTIPTNDPSKNPAVFHIKVTGVQEYPILELKNNETVIANNTGVVDFGTVEIGTNTTQTFTIKNTGKINLNLTGTQAVESSKPSVFSISTQPAQTTVIPNETVQFTLRYTPQTEGEEEGTITISNDSQNIQYRFTVKGTAHIKRPQIKIFNGDTEIIQNATLDLGAVILTRSATATITVKNVGDAALTLDASAISITGADAAAFSLVTLPGPNISVGSAGTSFSIGCAPIKSGENNAIISIPTNDPARNPTLFYIKVNGTGAYPPDNVAASGQSASSALITWTAVSGASGYYVYRSSTAGGQYTKINTAGITGTSYTNTGLSAGLTYYYCVSAYTGSGEGVMSAPVSATTYQRSTISVTLPVSGDVTPPQNLSIPKGETRVLQVSGATGTYQWYLNGSLISGATAAGYNLATAAMEAGVYEFMVVVTSADGKRSGSCRVRITN
jgi:hypothetical protein